MENPEMEWINDLSSMSNETKTLLAQLSKQTITIQQYRLECAEKDMLRNSAEAQNQMLRDAISLCINTVECASTDSNGNELPWYKAAKAALSTNTGSELLAELKRLRAQHEFSDGQAAYYARLCDTKDAELNSLRDELKSAREEVERAKADRNKSGVEERKKYLPKIQQLTADLAKAKAQCANLSDSLRECLGYCDRMGQEGVRERAVAALSPNCGRDYVHRSEVERAWREGFIDGDFGEASADDCWNQSRARKVATGEVT